MVVWQYHKLFPCCLIIGVLFLSSHCQSGFSKALWQLNYFFDCCCQHELEQHARPWMIKSANRSPGTVVPFPLLPCIWLLSTILHDIQTCIDGIVLSLVLQLSMERVRDAILFLPHLRFLDQQHVWGRLSQLSPQACQKGGWDLVRLRQGCPRATLEGPSASTFYGNLFTASWFIPEAMTGAFHSTSYFHQFIEGIK